MPVIRTDKDSHVIRIDTNSLKILHEAKDKILIHNKNRGITGRVNLSDAIRSLKNDI